MDALSSFSSMPMASFDQAISSVGGAGSFSVPSRIGARAGKTIDQTADDFESMFLSQMLQPMFSTIEVDDTFGGGHGEEVMRSMMVQEYGKVLAAKSDTPLNQAIRDDLIRKQEKADKPAYSKTGQVVAPVSTSSTDILS